MKVGFTGTQKGMTDEQMSFLYTEFLVLHPAQFHHGDCIGADAEAHEIYHEAMRDRYEDKFGGAWTIIHPPKNSSKRAFCDTIHKNAWITRLVPKDYLDRNKNIVDETDILFVCPGEMTEQLRSGTWSTWRYAIKTGKSYVIIFPDGTTSVPIA